MTKVLIAVGNPHFSFDQKNSAVANYLQSVKEFLSEKHEVVLFPAPSEGEVTEQAVSGKKGGMQAVKKLIRTGLPSFYNKLVDKKYLKLQEERHEKFKQVNHYDVLIEFQSFGSKLASIAASKGKKVILIYDAPIGAQYLEMKRTTGKYYRYFLEKEKQAVDNADAIVCYSRPVKEYLIEQLGAKDKEIRILPTLSFSKLQAKGEIKNEREELTIGFIGSFLSWHKLERLVRAFEEVAQKHEVARLLLIGYGEEWERIKKMRDASPVAGKIEMTGFVSDEELKELKSSIDIGIMPGSNWYGSPMKIFEYAALKVPVIAPPSPTIKDLFSEEELLYIDEEKPVESLVDLMSRCIENKEMREQYAISLYGALRERYSRERYREVFEGLLDV